MERNEALAPAGRLGLARLALDGLSVGDGFGERFFKPQASDLIAKRALPAPEWRWTDDTAMAISVVEVLARFERIDRDALARAFADRYLTEPVRGYGAGAHDILAKIGAGVPWSVAATSEFDGQGSYGNGGAMRAAPIGGYFWDDFELAAAEAGASADPTHAHLEGRAGAIAVAVASAAAVQLAKGLLEKPLELIEAALAHTPDGLTRVGIERARTLKLTCDVDAAVASLGNGSRISAQDTVPICLWFAARHIDNYAEALWQTVSALGDRDTTCAIVGGIVSLYVGREGLPADYLAAREALPPLAAGEERKTDG